MVIECLQLIKIAVNTSVFLWFRGKGSKMLFCKKYRISQLIGEKKVKT